MKDMYHKYIIMPLHLNYMYLTQVFSKTLIITKMLMDLGKGRKMLI